MNAEIYNKKKMRISNCIVIRLRAKEKVTHIILRMIKSHVPVLLLSSAEST